MVMILKKNYNNDNNKNDHIKTNSIKKFILVKILIIIIIITNIMIKNDDKMITIFTIMILINDSNKDDIQNDIGDFYNRLYLTINNSLIYG